MSDTPPLPLCRMHENLFLDEPVLDLEKLQKDFANLVKERVTTDPENMISFNNVFTFLGLV